MPETSFVLTLLWQGGLLPFAVALAVLAGGRALRLEALSPVLAIAAGLLASYFASLHAQWSPWPKVALDWLPWTVLAAAAGALALENFRSAGGRVAARFVIAAVATFLVVWPALGSFGVVKAAIAVAVTGALAALAWTLHARAARGTATQPFLLAVVAAGAGVAMMLDSSQSTGRLGGALAATLGACVLFALPWLQARFNAAAAGLTVIVLAVLLANAHLYAGFPLGYVALLAGALLAHPLLAGLLRELRQERLDWARVPSAVLTVLPVIVTVALAVKAASEYGGY